MNQNPFMTNNPGTERRVLDLDALVHCVQAMPNLVNDVNDFQHKIHHGMNAHGERLSQVCRLVDWLKSNFEYTMTQVANLQAEVAHLRQNRDLKSSLQEDFRGGEMTSAHEGRMTRDFAKARNYDGQMGLRLHEVEEFLGGFQGTRTRDRDTTHPAEADNNKNRLGLHEAGFPREVTGAQHGEMTTHPAEVQGNNASDEDAEGETDLEYNGDEGQLA